MRPIKEIVSKVISDLSTGPENRKRISEEDIRRLWRKAAGRFAGLRSQPTSLRKGKLIVVVEDSSLLYNLTLRKREILKHLANGLRDKIQDIQFRIGDISEGKGKVKSKKAKGKVA